MRKNAFFIAFNMKDYYKLVNPGTH